MIVKSQFGPITNDYPMRDGRPMAETDWYRALMNTLIQTLQYYLAAESQQAQERLSAAEAETARLRKLLGDTAN